MRFDHRDPENVAFDCPALASAHALADQDYDASVVTYSIDRQVADAVTSKSGLKSEIVAFAFDYAAQVNLDWQAFVGRTRRGRRCTDRGHHAFRAANGH